MRPLSHFDDQQLRIRARELANEHLEAWKQGGGVEYAAIIRELNKRADVNDDQGDEDY